MRDGCIAIGGLVIARAEDDYTNEACSTAITNCTDCTISQITNWLEFAALYAMKSKRASEVDPNTFTCPLPTLTPMVT